MSDEATAATSWRDRVRGCLFGGALGDALGAPFEGMPVVGGGDWERLIAGARPLAWTDDTALQLALARYLARVDGPSTFDDDELALEFARAWRDEPWRGYGANPPHIFQTVLAGGSWREAATSSFGGRGSLGNGGAMRAAPLGVLPAEPEGVAELARRSASITHAHPVGQDGAVLIAVVAWAAFAGRPAPDVLSAGAAQVATDEMRSAVDAIPASLETSDPVEVGRRLGSGIIAHEAAPAAVSAFLHHPSDPVAAIRFAVAMGGDTDTIAAMAGSLAGAAAGAAVLPGSLLDRLELRDDIRRLADALATRHGPH